MAYRIEVRVHQTTPDWFSIVEKTIFVSGTWVDSEGKQFLRMDSSGTSGTLRFYNEVGNYFIVAMGVHNYKPWTDIVPNLTTSDSGVKVHPTYYQDGAGGRTDRLWAQARTTEKVDAKGKKLTINVTGDGNELVADIFIAQA